MPSLELKIPPPVVAFIVAVAMWGASLGGAAWPVPDIVRLALALALVAVGVAFSAAGIVEFRRARTTLNPRKPEAASSLVSLGVFKITRNPMYVGLFLVLVGWAVVLSSLWALLGPLAFALYIHRFQITPEERVLSSMFGAEYLAYKERVRRWL